MAAALERDFQAVHGPDDDEGDCMQQHVVNAIPNDASNVDTTPKASPTELFSQEKQLDVQYLNTDTHTDLCVALSKPGLSNNEKWKVYNSVCLQNPDISEGEKKQFENESTWADECVNAYPDAASKSSDSPDDVEPQEKESVFISWISQTCELLMYLDIGEAPRYLCRMKNLVDTFLS